MPRHLKKVAYEQEGSWGSPGEHRKEAVLTSHERRHTGKLLPQGESSNILGKIRHTAVGLTGRSFQELCKQKGVVVLLNQFVHWKVLEHIWMLIKLAFKRRAQRQQVREQRERPCSLRAAGAEAMHPWPFSSVSSAGEGRAWGKGWCKKVATVSR